MKKFIHGDVILKQINSKPNDTKEYTDNAVQYGEVTGHAHRLTGDFKITFTMGDFEKGIKVSNGGFNGTKYLEVGENGAELSHEEHKTIPLPPGLYKCFTVREFDHFEKLIRQVVD